MSLHIYEYEQGSEEWRQARAGVLTASVVGKLLTPTLQLAKNQTSRGLIREIVAERLTGVPTDTYTTRDMERGSLDEPYAREIYSEHMGCPVDETGFMVRDIEGHKLGYSPDGLIADIGLLEIKSRKPRLQLDFIIDGEIPHDHMAQMQAGMLVADRDWCAYVSYSGGLRMPIQFVNADERWHDAIKQALAAFEKEAEVITSAYKAATVTFPETEYIDHFGDELELIL